MGHLGGDMSDVLKVEQIDFCIESNGESNHTNKFDLMTRSTDKCLVVRRGQSFKLDLLLNRPYDVSKDGVSFIFNVADIETRGPSSATCAAIPLQVKGTETSGTWSAIYESHNDLHLIVSITPATDCIVAAWHLEVDTKLSGGSFLSYKHPLPIYILFNPWCPNDSVYLSAPEQRDEYVLETGGLLFFGSSDSFGQAPWNYAQFDADILDCALYLVSNVGKVKVLDRNDPVLMARGLSASINEQDDRGVISGNWAKEMSRYSGGTHPSKWVGSLLILQDYYKNKQPVKYGQCWVYAGVLTTICRALGIPCRPVTGFNAAHDGDKSLTIDMLVDDQGNHSYYGRDSTWNFHVWNEVWMERPDLGPEYGGWQILDSTPQERSDYIYRCGPASLRAVVNGEIQKPYDTAYVFAEVNADMVYWKKSKEDKRLKFISQDTKIIGQYLSTKAIGRMERQDLTNSYKQESSPVERITIVNALRLSNSPLARYYLDQGFNDDVTVTLDLLEEIKIGESFNVAVNIKNHSSTESHKVHGVLRVDNVTYTGVVGDLVRKIDFDVSLGPESNENVKMLVTFNDYYKSLIADQGSFKMACIATDKDQEFDYFLQDNFRVKNPDIQISIDGTPVANQEFNVTATVENPLPIPLTKCKFYIQAPGLKEQLKIQLNEDVAPGQFVTVQFKLSSPWTGSYQISAKFQSWEMRNVNGYLSIMIN